MPRRFRRSRVPRRRPRRTRRMYRRRRSVAVVHRFKRIADLGTVGCSNIGLLSYATSFSISQLPNVSEFTSLYDNYRIEKVVFRMRPYWTDLSVSGTTVQSYALAPIYTAIDLDSAALPASTATLRQYSTCRSHTALRPITRVLRPRPLTEIYESALGTSYALAPKNVWLDTARTSVPHYGIKVAASFPNVAAANWISYTVEAEFHLAFRGPN